MATRIKSASVAVFANDTQLDRLQAFGVTSRLDSEDLKEIGNLDIVEVIDNVPTVDVTLDSNEYGSAKTLAKLAGKNYDWATINVTRTGDNQVTVSSGYYYIDEMKYTLAASSGITITAPTGANQKRIDVISIGTGGANSITLTQGVATTGTPTAPNTPTGHLKLAEVQSESDASSGAVALTDLNVLNCYDETTVTLKDFEYANVDFIVPVKERGDNTDVTYPITRTMYVEDAFVNRYDAAFSVNGLATESFSLEADNKTWFLNTAATVWVDRFGGDGTTLGFTLSYTPTQRENEDYVIKAYKYDSGDDSYVELTEDASTNGFTVSGTTLTCTEAPQSDETLIVRYATNACPASAQPFFKRVPGEETGHPEVAGGLRHGQVEVYLSDDNNNFVLRLQSVSISASLTREALYELGHLRAYDRPMTFPIPITMTVEALSSDLELFARLCGATFSTEKELSINDFIKNLNLVVKIYREDDEQRAIAPELQSTPLKTITVENVSVTDESIDVRVDSNATQTFGLKANTNLTITARI